MPLSEDLQRAHDAEIAEAMKANKDFSHADILRMSRLEAAIRNGSILPLDKVPDYFIQKTKFTRNNNPFSDLTIKKAYVIKLHESHEGISLKHCQELLSQHGVYCPAVISYPDEDGKSAVRYIVLYNKDDATKLQKALGNSPSYPLDDSSGGKEDFQLDLGYSSLPEPEKDKTAAPDQSGKLARLLAMSKIEGAIREGDIVPISEIDKYEDIKFKLTEEQLQKAWAVKLKLPEPSEGNTNNLYNTSVTPTNCADFITRLSIPITMTIKYSRDDKWETRYIILPDKQAADKLVKALHSPRFNER